MMPTIAATVESFMAVRKRLVCQNSSSGSMILVDGQLLILTESGDLVLAEANPQAYREKARARILDSPPCRAHIALSDGRLFARDQGKLGCWKLTGE